MLDSKDNAKIFFVCWKFGIWNIDVDELPDDREVCDHWHHFPTLFPFGKPSQKNMLKVAPESHALVYVVIFKNIHMVWSGVICILILLMKFVLISV